MMDRDRTGEDGGEGGGARGLHDLLQPLDREPKAGQDRRVVDRDHALDVAPRHVERVAAGGRGVEPVGDALRREADRLAGGHRQPEGVGALGLDREDPCARPELADGDRDAAELGVYPALSRLELLLYPSAKLTIANEALTLLGVIEVIPPEAPLTLLVWGPKRVLPVRLTGFTITEEAFDPNLNPIRAKASLELQVLNYHDLGLVSVGGALFMAHQLAKEAMAGRARAPSLSAVGSATLGI